MLKHSFSLCCITLTLQFVGCANGKHKAAEQVIDKIEAYKAHNLKLPDNLTALGLEEKEEDPVHYEKLTDTSYQVWYGQELGESKTYSSKSKTWK